MASSTISFDASRTINQTLTIVIIIIVALVMVVATLIDGQHIKAEKVGQRESVW